MSQIAGLPLEHLIEKARDIQDSFDEWWEHPEWDGIRNCLKFRLAILQGHLMFGTGDKVLRDRIDSIQRIFAKAREV